MSDLYRHHPRPSARVMESGPATLSDFELLAAVTGSEKSAAALLDRFHSVSRVLSATPSEIKSVQGVGVAVAARLASTRELWTRVAYEGVRGRILPAPEDVYALLGPSMQDLAQESMRVVFMDRRKRFIRVEEVFLGTSNECFAAPAPILKRALALNAAAIVMAHNHPTGDPSPSVADHEVTRRVVRACHEVGIEFTDHIIIGRRAEGGGQPYFSFREAGLIGGYT